MISNAINEDRLEKERIRRKKFPMHVLNSNAINEVLPKSETGGKLNAKKQTLASPFNLS